MEKQRISNESLEQHFVNIPDDYLLTYYEHQYARIEKHEEQRLGITNIIITLSVLAFTFGFEQATRFSQIIGYALLSIMIIANLFAVFYIFKTKSWIETHKLRAKGVLKERVRPLYDYDKRTQAKYSRWALSRWQIQMLLHVLLIIVAIIMVIFLSIS